jgi:glycosyltransferase involved in cell wall biosynthesis
VVAEASACGLPIAGFGGGGIEEVVENAITGFLVPFGNIEELSHAMEYFVNNPQAIARMGGAGHRRAGQLFNRDIQIPEICSSLINSAKEHEGK